MPPTNPEPSPSGELVLYQTEDQKTRIQVRLEDRTVWLTQKQISELFQVSVSTVDEHLKNLYADHELTPEATIRKFRIVQTEGSREVARMVDCYSLDAILAVGYRVRSLRGTQFRRWATQRLPALSRRSLPAILQLFRLQAGKQLGRWVQQISANRT